MMYTVDQFLPTLAAAIVGMAIGGLWYSPLMFDRAWKKHAFMGRTIDEAQMKKDAPKAMLGMFIVLLFKVCIMSSMFVILGVDDVLTGIQYGLWLGVGFIATAFADSVFFERRPLQLYLINTSYHLISMMAMGAVLGAW